jgi:hypothetical protein
MALFGQNFFGQQSQISPGNISALGTATSDIFAGLGDLTQAQGDRAEASAYGLAAQYAGQEAQFTAMNTAIQQAQSDRELYLGLGRERGEIAGAGFSAGGSALDILRSSASQGALQTAAIGQQGLIQEQGYEEQAQSYITMENAANNAASAAGRAAIGSFVGAGISALAAFV